jgi:hypothetical protein
MYGPLAVLVEKPQGTYKNVAVYGDSIANGNGESSTVGGGGGFIARPLDATTASCLYVSRGGDSFNGTVARTAMTRLVR